MTHISMNVHHVESVSVNAKSLQGTHWIAFDFVADDGSTFSLAVFGEDRDALLSQIAACVTPEPAWSNE